MLSLMMMTVAGRILDSYVNILADLVALLSLILLVPFSFR